MNYVFIKGFWQYAVFGEIERTFVYFSQPGILYVTFPFRGPSR
jgi:hypothetical protein